MATCYPCDHKYEKVNLYSLETLPNEIILNIFTHLTIKDLRSCAQVSKNFYAIRYDKTLWTKILVTSTKPSKDFAPPRGYATPRIMPQSFLVEALLRGARYLGLSNLSLISTSQPDFPPTNQVKYLALSSTFMGENYFRELILSCHNLIKLSVANPCGTWKSDDLIKAILQNSNSLKVLDLSECHYLKYQDIKSILSSCLNLTEANFSYNLWHELVPNLSVIFESFPPSIEKLALSGAVLSNDAIIILITQCNKLTDLDLSWAHLIDEPELRSIKVQTKIQLESLYMRGFANMLDLTHLEMLIPCENSLQVLDISHCKNMTRQAIELIVTRCLYLTAVDFCGSKHAAFICKNLTTNIEKVGLSTTDLSNKNFKILVRRCNKIKELDVSHTKVVINEVVDEIILFLSSTLEKLSLPTTYSEHTFSSFSQFDYYQLSKLGFMPKLKCLWIFRRYGMKRIMDLWEKQFPNVVLLCYTDFSCQSHCDYTQYCNIPEDIKYIHHIIVPNPNIAKSMSVDKTIWEIPCKSIKLSELQEEKKTGMKIPLISRLPTAAPIVAKPVSVLPQKTQQTITSRTQRNCIWLRGLPFEAQVEHILEFLGDHAQSIERIVYQEVHFAYSYRVIDFMIIHFLYHHDFFVTVIFSSINRDVYPAKCVFK